ncbi:MAG TPA: hypothetical protein VFT87_04015 [Candidatus Saccharimonadales bacterium]|nr:hypothetical protein [Candidatus Saccharimonadales bacterium]
MSNDKPQWRPFKKSTLIFFGVNILAMVGLMTAYFLLGKADITAFVDPSGVSQDTFDQSINAWWVSAGIVIGLDIIWLLIRRPGRNS